MNTPRRSFFILTQGCKVNQYESQAIREAWTRRGMKEMDSPQNVDLVLINSCAVTERAISDLKRHVRKIYTANPAADIIIAGCAVKALPELADLDGVKLAVSQEKKHLLTGIDDELSLFSTNSPEELCFPNLAINTYKRSRGVVKIQDGCSHGCTYCIIPITRGPSISRDPQDILDEVGRLFRAGVHEISLCGINLRHFGRDLSPRMDFWDLLLLLEHHLAHQWSGQARIRLSSLEPSELTPKGLEVLKQCTLLCPHLHISLQSGSPTILRRMGRGHYTPTMVTDFVEKLHTIWPLFALGADIITGFPGETPVFFQETMRCVQKLPLTYAHVFPYSNRPGTPATLFPEQIPHNERRDRAATIRTLVQQKRSGFLAILAKQPRMNVIFENQIKGMSEYYVQCVLTDQTTSLRADHTIHSVLPVGHSDMQLLVKSSTEPRS